MVEFSIAMATRPLKSKSKEAVPAMGSAVWVWEEMSMRLSYDICHCYMERTVQNFDEEKPLAGHKQFFVATNISDMIE